MKMMVYYIATFLLLHPMASIKGRWNLTSSESNITNIEFKNDGTYACYIKNALVINGLYTFNSNDSMLTVDDDGCLDITGRYKVNFSSADSIRFTAISDDCLTRKNSVEGALLVK